MVSTTSKFPQHGTYTAKDVFTWLEILQIHRSKQERSLLKSAVEQAMQSHTDATGTLDANSLTRNIAIADELINMNLDVATLCVAILHNPLASEDSLNQLGTTFGEGVCKMAKELAKVETLVNQRVNLDRSNNNHLENMRRLLLNIADDIRVILIVLAARLEFMRGVKHLPKEEQRLAAQDTHDLYAPLANRLGIWQIKWELEDLSLRYLQPDIYDEMVRLVGVKRAQREQFIQVVIEQIETQLSIAHITAEVHGRPKHIYSIWRKMQRKNVGFHQIFDLRAVRILVKNITDCYATLGIIHSMWSHIPGEFDDYIATPKANLYRSIHTAVIGPKDKPLEIQIRTHEMHEHSELGVAAHWRYKEQGKADPEFEKRIVMIRNWLDNKDDGCFQEDSQQVSECDASRIYVFTPKGKVIELGKGATPLDFAYSIHTDIGHRCRGAKIDGKIRQLTTRLSSGQMVEIITTKEASPSRDWLNPHLGYLHTSRAKNRVRHWFKQQNYDENIRIGRQHLAHELKRLNIEKPALSSQLEKFNLNTKDDLYAAIGCGDISPIQIASHGIKKTDQLPPSQCHSKAHKFKLTSVIVEGMSDIMTQLAHCCKPTPHDAISGFITQGKGISVHRQNCHDLLHLQLDHPERIVRIYWEGQENAIIYPVNIMVNAYDRKGLLNDISSIFIHETVNVIRVNTQSDPTSSKATMEFQIEIQHIEQLSCVLEKISQISDVSHVYRQD